MVFQLCILLTFHASVEDVRSYYKEAYANSSSCDKLVNATKSQVSNPTMRAYYATGLAFQANESWNPATKLSKANEASGELNKAVTASKENLEIRFLRFSFECQVPEFLGLSKHLAEDKLKLMALKNTSHPMWSWMHNFFSQCNKLSNTEKLRL